MRRDGSDELALAVSSDPTNYRTILLGDSVTRNATFRYALGEAGEVANLATTFNFGIYGEVLLLQRYLNTHRAPKYVVLVLRPHAYGSIADLRIIRHVLWHTFRRPEERSFLKSYLPDIDDRDWLPAIAEVRASVVEPAFSLLNTRYRELRGRNTIRIASGSLDPDPNAATEASTVVPSALEKTIATGFSPVVTPINAAALRQVCLMSVQRGFRVRLAWPPLVPELEKVSSTAMTELEARVRDIMVDCHIGEITHFNRLRTYMAASFMQDMTHLYGNGWEEQYASDVRKYLRELPD
jgi:hypothetical protein